MTTTVPATDQPTFIISEEIFVTNGGSAVIRRNHQYDDIGHAGAARTHGGERLMARRVDEGDPVPAIEGHLIGADMLGDAASLAGRNVR